MANVMNVIYPYKYNGTWVFDDEKFGLLQEPFVSGADDIIEKMTAKLYNAENGFILLFSSTPFPGYQIEFEWRREESGGNWYDSKLLGIEGWLCPAMFKYFDAAPTCLYAQFKEKTHWHSKGNRKEEHMKRMMIGMENYEKLPTENLSADQRRFLVDLNRKLVDVEQGINKEYQMIKDQLAKRVADTDDWIDDSEIDCYITFHMREDDPDYDVTGDNVLEELQESPPLERGLYGIADGNNHNEYEGWEDHPMRDEHHCWLYHCLYDHAHLSWINMLRIGSVKISMDVQYQKILTVDLPGCAVASLT